MTHFVPQSFPHGFDVERPALRPRTKGMTSIIDFGPDTFGWTTPDGLSSYLDCVAEYIDYAKIYAMNALLLPKGTVKQIIHRYRDHSVIPYAGGILFEYAVQREEIDGYIRHLRAIGMPLVEVSENYITLSDEERERHIDRLRQSGFNVIYEFGRKNPTEVFSLDILENIIRSNIDAGVEHTIIEQSEIDYVAAEDPDVLSQIIGSSWFDKIFIEANPYTFPKEHVGLLDKFGADVNLANIAADQALRLQGLRYGIGRAVNYAILDQA
ncbi:phosphosulfolactate synthase [Alcaligenaceae bacterium]|nr:phosphosulfolactate synthase [Alcaligenaceae bacterium]